MPIKFRCQHCQQLLGISRSRADAVVDCPRCGRALRVPDLDGRIRKLPDPKTSVNTDSALMSALSELSVLNDMETQPAAGEESTAAPERQNVVTLDPVDATEPVDVGVAPSTAVIESEPDTEGPVALEESLEELAAFRHQTFGDQVSDELLADMRQSRDRRRPATIVLFGALLLAAGFAAGWFAGHVDDGVTAAASAEVRDPANAEEDGPPAENDLAVVLNALVVHGTVTYQDASGNAQPDASATLLLLPAERAGTLRLNARSLKRPQDHPDHVLTAAALTAMGGDMVVADSAGRYQLTSDDPGPLTVLVVSKHMERPDDVAVPAEIAELLESWFDSTSHICGRLSVQSSAVADADEPVDFQFTPGQ